MDQKRHLRPVPWVILFGGPWETLVTVSSSGNICDLLYELRGLLKTIPTVPAKSDAELLGGFHVISLLKRADLIVFLHIVVSCAFLIYKASRLTGPAQLLKRPADNRL